MPVPAPELHPLPAFASGRGYSTPKPKCPIDLRLDGNEGMTPPSSLLESLVEDGPRLLHDYPTPAPIEARIAEVWGVSASRVLLTAGGDDALLRCFQAMLSPERHLVLPVPTFEMLPRYAQATNAAVTTVAWPRGPFPTEAVIEAVRPDTALVCVVSPNNPTGATASPEDLERVARAAPHALIAADLAYEEFADQPLMQTALSLPNVVAVRTFSKAWGLAGARVGYAVGSERVIGWLRAAGNPYAVSHPSLRLVERRLSLPRHDVDAFIERVREERGALSLSLQLLGAEPLPSQGNFVLARFRDPCWVRDALAGLGIAVRIFPGRADLDGCLRITCPGDAAAFARLDHALQSALSPQALLLDMDGVLADVSGSYRRAILETSRGFGVELDAAGIAAAKAEGNSNNDWVLTTRLLARRGVEVGLAEVTERFERLYQGTADAPGLWQTESLCCEPSTLERFASRHRLAVVTGRPRSDATRFLEAHGLSRFVSALVCMEDAPLKPDPAPVRLALERLGVVRAWMIGDSPDDMRAARAAGIVPIGIVAPGDRFETTAPSLESAGASRVLQALSQLEGLLP